MQKQQKSGFEMEIYLDSAATTRVCPEAAQAAAAAMTEVWGNPSSSHSQGRRAAALVKNARAQVAAALGAKPEELTFVSCGTEADHWALTGGMAANRGVGRHLITTATEHDAVLQAAEKLKKQGCEVTLLQPEKDGRVTVESLLDALRPDTALVSVMLVNNETGAVNPVAEISRALRVAGSKALLHTDAVQGFLHVPFTPKGLGVDLVSVSGHKIHAPKGIGALWIRPNLHLQPFLPGGGQEKGLRSGTEPVPNICAFGAAAESGKKQFADTLARLRLLRDRCEELLRAELPGITFPAGRGADHILSVSLPGYRSEVLLNRLDAEGICVSRSSACKRGGRSHVLQAMGVPADVIDGAIRVSFCRDNTIEEVEYFVRALAAAAAELRHR